MLIKTANQGLSYIERHCRDTGLKLDLHETEKNRRSSFTNTPPYDVLLPCACTSGLFDDFEWYDQYRGYETVVPANPNVLGAAHNPTRADPSAKRHRYGDTRVRPSIMQLVTNMA
jgi:hypothetical protein